MSVTVAIDAMGGDRAPGEIVDGAVQAAEQLDVRVLLVGREEVVGPMVPDTARSVEVVGATEVVGMSDAPTSVRSKKDASIVVCAQLVRDGKADALVSAGQHRRHDGGVAPAHRAHQGCRPARRSRHRSRCPVIARRSSSTPAPPSTARRSGWCTSR